MRDDNNMLPPRYKQPERIGRGGMGDIFRATDSVLGRVVAIKLLGERYAEDPSIRQRFTREALAAARLSGSPNIVTIFDVGEWERRPFIVMEYLPGGSLEQKTRDGRPSEGESLAWLEQAGRALDSAHAQGIVHRDVKPGNLLLDREDVVHVADFGIASAAGLDSLTMTGTILGTAGYLSPEQARGDRATPASDRYALGVVAFELFTGQRPFEAESATAEAAAHVHAEVPSVCAKDAALPCELDPVFERALAKDPDARFPSSAEFVAALRHAIDEAAGTTGVFAPAPPRTRVTVPLAREGEYEPYSGSPDSSGPPRRRSLLPLVVGALLLAGAAAAGVVLASTLGDGGGDKAATPRPRFRTVIKTVTTQGSTKRVTVTMERTTPAAPPTTTTPSVSVPTGGTPDVAAGKRLTDQSTFLNRAGRYEEALPVAQRALDNLKGSGDLYEAYANFNVGNALAHLGRCQEALPYLDRSEQIQGSRSEIDAARSSCTGNNGNGD